ncbi:DNA helicase-2/ATP-dependent DNA helicase PcrA [Aeromicrobium sp. SORGH_AS981]|uniref:UvrD-helicase domain-containing protein n=1 Tax=Aeromicrobium sp. SORGH_AS_0981 TaxID=3041802 RepID=UPI00285C4C6B|nr:UvrD-helicase domain-containing protein [Aeromicrobium sp. SORGH_AS_0981]MDR6119723.1 DNA helicase-2/ATP-dependent DNA helicase PcrA [Aeromicrobium sp. SORGH_AS_0981]
MSALVSLDAEQAQVARVDASACQVVLAAAGSGKTETVAALVGELVESQLHSAHDVLVLSFSRAAVTAVRRRFADRDLRGVSVRTLDGIAARIIGSAESAEEPAPSFDGRIRQATRLLGEGEVPDELEAVAHVVVDEIQDVVGDRARLVLAILHAIRSHAGFTLLGDPQQAIYDFQLADARDMNSPAFLRSVDTGFAPRLVQLRGEYRSIGDDARRVVEMSQTLPPPGGAGRTSQIRRVVADVLKLEDLTELADLLPTFDGNVAVLCADNGQAMLAHAALRDLEVEATLQASAEQRGVASWVAAAVPFGGRKVKRSDFEDGWDPYETGYSAADAWRLLKRSERGFNTPSSLDVSRLAAAVALRDVAAELLEAAHEGVVVSTVHRSKGLEFDTVVMVNSSGWLPADADDSQASVAYVALSRARRRLLSVPMSVDRRLRRDGAMDRWIRAGHKKWQTFGLEIQPADLREPTDPARSKSVQDLVVAVRAGDPVDLRLDPLAPKDMPRYRLEHDGELIGRTNERFGQILRRRFHGDNPPFLSGLRVGGFESRGCPPEFSVSGAADLWRAPVVSGMSTIEW